MKHVNGQCQHRILARQRMIMGGGLLAVVMLAVAVLLPALRIGALPTPPPSAADLVQVADVLSQSGNNQIRIKLKYNGLIPTADGIESTGEQSYTLGLSELVSTGALGDRRHLITREEVSQDGKFSYYIKYDYLPSNLPTPGNSCVNAFLSRKAYVVGGRNLSERPFTDGWPYANWWPDGFEVVMLQGDDDIGEILCFEVTNHQPSGGTNFIYRINKFYHRTEPSRLSAAGPSWQSATETYKVALTTTLPVNGAIKVYKYNIAQVPKGTTSCDGDSIEYKAIAATDVDGRYTASTSDSHKKADVNFLRPGWGSTYCFAVWDNEGRRGVAGPVFIPPPQSVSLATTGNAMGFEHIWEKYACPIPGFLGLTDTTNYIKTTGGGIPGGTHGVNVLMNRKIVPGYSLVAKDSNGGPFTLADQLKYIHDALSYSDDGENPSPSFSLNNYKSRLYSRGVRDHMVTKSAMGSLVNNSHSVFRIELERPATTRTEVAYITGGGTATGTNKTSFGDYVLDGSEDYVITQGSVIFEPGEYRKFVSVPIINDCVEDSDETIQLALNDPNGSTGDVALDRWFAANASPVASYTIKNHDTVNIPGQPPTTTTTVPPTTTTTPPPTTTTTVPVVVPIPTTTLAVSQQESVTITTTTVPPTTTTTVPPTTTTTTPPPTTTVAVKDLRDCSALKQAYIDAVQASVRYRSRDAAKVALANAAKEVWKECEAYNRSL